MHVYPMQPSGVLSGRYISTEFDGEECSVFVWTSAYDKFKCLDIVKPITEEVCASSNGGGDSWCPAQGISSPKLRKDGGTSQIE